MTDRVAISLCVAGALMIMGVANSASALTALSFHTEKPLCGSDMSAKDAVIMTDRILHTPMSKASQAQASNCVVMAAIGGAASAQAMLGAHYAQSGYFRANMPSSPLMPQDVEAALYWLRSAAVAGNAEAEYQLGRLYEYGLGVDQDDAIAAQYYEKAKKGHVYDAGRAVLRIQSRGKATARFMAAWQDKANAGDTSAMLKIASAYISGDPVIQSFTEAAAWLQKAADAGDSTAQSRLARLYLDGAGVAKDKNQAVDLFLKASLGSDHTGDLWLIGLYKDPDVKSDRKAAIVKRAAMAGGQPFTDAVTVPDEKPDMAEVERLAQKEDKDAEYTMGIMYLGVFKDPEDLQKAQTWLQRAASHGSTDAEINLGDMAYTGKGSAQDYTAALSWYEKAGIKGDGMGLYNAAIMYRDGLGVASDPIKAYTYGQRMQLRGDGRAQTLLQGLRPKINVIDRARSFGEACRMYFAWFAA